jgi:drug/metabolite transporter (DMT)-like permease
MGLIEPLIAVLLGAAFLAERLTLKTMIGGACILVAVSVVLDICAGRADVRSPRSVVRSP